MDVDESLLFERLHAGSPESFVYALLGRQEVARLKARGTPLWYADPKRLEDAPMPTLIQVDARMALRVYAATAGVFIVSDRDLETVRRSLFSFSAMERIDGTLRTVPFHDPTIFPAFLEGLAREDIARLFAVAKAFATPRIHDEHLILDLHDAPRVIARAVHIATGWNRERSWEPAPREPRVEPAPPRDEPPPGGAPQITERQLEALRAAQIREMIGAPDDMRRADVAFPLLTANAETQIEQALDSRLMQNITANLWQYAPEVVRPLSLPDLEGMLATALRRARSRGLADRQRIFEFAKLMFVIAPGFDRHPVMQRVLAETTGTPDERFSRAIQTMTFADWESAQKLFDPRDWELPEIR